MFHHGPMNPGAELIVRIYMVFAVVVASFGIYCLVKGIKEWFK